MALIVGDVSDKGIPAAIFMAQSHALLRAAIQNNISATHALEKINNLLFEMNEQSLFVTVIYGILNRSSGKFRYTRAGHELPMLLNADGNISFPNKGVGMALGIFENVMLEERSLTIPDGGFMLLYSDGIADDVNRDFVSFGSAHLNRSCKKHRTQNSAQQTCQAVFDALVEFQNGAPQIR